LSLALHLSGRNQPDAAARSCLISNSLKATVHFEPEIDIAAEHAGALTGVTQ